MTTNRKHWIPYPTVLQGTTIDLVPLEEHHLEELYQASGDKELWKQVLSDCSDRDTFFTVYRMALEVRDNGMQYPFVIIDKQTKKLIGSTQFFEMHEADKKLEIGWTWITCDYWGSVVNLECKLLLLTYCFEVLKTNRVQLKTKDDNLRSRKAIEKIGGVFEGILRKDKIQKDGTTRNAAYYSILNDEWESAKNNIHVLMSSK
ncbi:GNAT family N-acetyltransferase [Myroides sp. M-43]|uniref:GNAT family N-acetyltransferase n=1 Tax=Myroides oncorhynchi TaxID=2893756 RepID=UPI001E50A232|nr:GNAT family protein [Myroides oncorhynchi]MCC9043996.1 GNAT family N-acetyltransferase [Myroides oncorhynchi]